MDKPRGFRLRNKRLPVFFQTDKAIARAILGMVYEAASARDEEVQINVDDIRSWITHPQEGPTRPIPEYRAMWMSWRNSPIGYLRFEDGCTIRRLSGREVLISKQTLDRLSTVRACYQHVRHILELEAHMSLHLRFVGVREPGRQWAEHEVQTSAMNCHRYLQGSILLAVVHANITGVY